MNAGLWKHVNLREFPLKISELFSQQGEKTLHPTLSISNLGLTLSLSLSLPTESPSPTVGNTMSQRMAHWHKCHGQLQIYSKIHLGLFFIVHIL